jgi:hypothetical protein
MMQNDLGFHWKKWCDIAIPKSFWHAPWLHDQKPKDIAPFLSCAREKIGLFRKPFMRRLGSAN